MKITKLFFILLILTPLKNSFACEEKSRDYIYMVGSSTVSPLMAATSEEFARVQRQKKSPIITPVVKSTGSGVGFKLFCSGIGSSYPDFVNASRPINFNEIKICNENKVNDIIEIKIGYDGIVFGNFKSGPKAQFTKEQIFLALAEKIIDKKTKKLVKNPYKNWKEISSELPDEKIVVYGPPNLSGTRDVFAEMVMEGSCFSQKDFVSHFKNEEDLKSQCLKIRKDGKFIESGENDNLIIDNLRKNHNAFGILGFNFLQVNKNIIQGAKIDGVYPSVKNISSKKYPLSRPLFVYFKKEHLNLAPKVKEFIAEIINKDTIGNRGYLINSGLVSLDKNELTIMQKNTLSKLKK